MKKALVVDDLRMHRTLIKASLTILRFEVDLAEDGLQGMAKLKENQYDVVFSDIEMPNMNGFEFLARLRRDPASDACRSSCSRRSKTTPRWRA